MGLNLKDEETVALVTEVASRMGVTKTRAVRELARQRLAELDLANQSERVRREAEVTEWLRNEVWPQTAALTPLSRTEQEELLGYNDMTHP
jgi:hypothetical protein